MEAPTSGTVFAKPQDALKALRQVIREEVDPNKTVLADVERMTALIAPERLWVPGERDPKALRALTQLWPAAEQLEDMGLFLQEALYQVCAGFPSDKVEMHPGSKPWPVFAQQLLHPLLRYALCEALQHADLIDLLEEGDCMGGSAVQLNAAGLRVHYVALVSAGGKLVHTSVSPWTDPQRPLQLDPVAARTLIYRIQRAREGELLQSALLHDFGPKDTTLASRRSSLVEELMQHLEPITQSVMGRYWPQLASCFASIFGLRVSKPLYAELSPSGPIRSRCIAASDAGYLLERERLEAERSRLKTRVPTLPEALEPVYTLQAEDRARLLAQVSRNPTSSGQGHAAWLQGKLGAYLQRHRFLARDSVIEQHGWMEELVWDPDFEAQRLGLVAAALIPALLSSTADLEQQALYLDGDPQLVIRDSAPRYALLPGTQEVQLVLSQPCAWAPELKPACCARGIEPLSALALLLALREAGHLEKLECLLLAGFQRKGCKALLDAGALRKADQRVDGAYRLLESLAAYLLDQYGQQIRESLQEHFDEEDLKPFVPAGAQDDCSHLIHYGLDWEIPSWVLGNSTLRPAVMRLRHELALIFERFRDCVPECEPWNPGQELYGFVSRSYQLSHEMSGGDCRVGSMAAALFGSRASHSQVFALRHCMGDFLASPAGQEHFATTCALRGTDVATAALHYREGRSPFASDLEYAILAWTLNIRVGIFADGYPTEKEPVTGMILPSGWHGPDTKCFLSFFCTNNFTFYGAHPRWRTPADASGDLKKALAHQTQVRGGHSGFFI